MSDKLSLMREAFRRITPPNADADRKAIELEETDPSKLYASIVTTLACGVLLALLLAATTRIDELAKATGEIIPEGDVIAIQHLEGGLVAEILVSEGQEVEAGQSLVRLAPVDTETDLNQLQARRANLVLTAERHRAFLEHRDPDFRLAKKDNEIVGSNLTPLFVREQSSLFDEQKRSFELQHAVLRSRLEQREEEFEGTKNQLVAAENGYQVLVNQLRRRRDLQKKGLSTSTEINRLELEEASSQGRIARLRAELERGRSAVAEATDAVEEFRSSTRSQSRQDLVQSVAELEELEERIRGLQGRSDRLTLKAPAGGIVQGMQVKSLNSVVGPGQTIMELVPLDKGVLASIRINPADIASVSLGQKVDVRVSAFDFTLYGNLSGEIVYISPSTFLTEEGMSYYRSYVRLEKDHFGAEEDGRHVLPGMTLDADINTGTRTVLGYLLKPVSRGWQTALSER